MSAVRPLPEAVDVRSVYPHVLAGVALEGRTARLAALIDPVFVDEIGWDPATSVMSIPAQHPLLGRPTCVATGCSATAPAAAGVCQSCRARLGRAGLAVADIGMLATRPPQARGWETNTDSGCLVVACLRPPRNRDGHYCDAHQLRVRREGKRDSTFDEGRWQVTEPPVSRGGQVNFRGLPSTVVVEVLVALQLRSRRDRVKTKDGDLRAFVNALRSQQVSTIAEHVIAADPDGTFQALVNASTAHIRRALSTPETEVDQDVWDLTVFGHHGTVSFVNISQPWLRQITKRWAADDLPRRKIRPGRRTSGGLAVRHHVNCLVRLSARLSLRDDHGDVPAALGRRDMETFLHRLAYQESTGQISTDARIRSVGEVRHVLSRVRAMGLTRPGGPAAGLGEDFTLAMADMPSRAERGEPGRDLPLGVMRQICSHLDAVASPVMRAGFELAIDTGRRPEEICDLPFDCLARDDDGRAVLVYNNHKANRLGRRLPITEPTAEVILAQQRQVRARFPDTPIGLLRLLPTDRRNPHGVRAITAFSLAFAHRVWIDAMPPLVTIDGTPFDKSKAVLYAYRHTYAQRHADAGVGIDVLAELMDHRKLDTTTRYYRVGEKRRHEAVDKVAAMQFDRHGTRVWRTVEQLLDSEHARRAIGEVAVPFGNCAEPSNVSAGGNACPYRFRCVGCDHFRTDVSYLPDLQAYLDDLLRNRERLLATSDGIDDWARTEAMPSDHEITAIRRLIDQITGGLAELTDADRGQVEQAVAVVRRHRTAMLGMPSIRQPLPTFRPEGRP